MQACPCCHKRIGGAGVALLRYDRRSFRTPRSRMLGKRQVDAGDTDDGLPRGFLVGAIVKVRVAHRLHWACELLGLRGEELPRDVGSERRGLEVPASCGLRT